MKLKKSKDIITITSNDYIFTFGKYKGYKFEYVADNEPSYILWLADNNVVKFSNDMWRIVNALERDDREYYDGIQDIFWGYVDPPY